MRIEAVTVSIDYADFLEHTLPGLLAAVDDLVVVTSPDDARTRRLCAGTRAIVIATRDVTDASGTFHAGTAINAGLRHLKRDGWVLSVDADIMLCGRHPLKSLALDAHKLYGVDRFHCRGHAEWQRIKAQRRTIATAAVPTFPELPIGYRIAMPGAGGYLPCGYFQLWCPRVSGIHDYAVGVNGAEANSDMLHAARWPRELRELIPEVFAIELSTAEPDAIGPNWSGRRTPEFSATGGPYQRAG